MDPNAPAPFTWYELLTSDLDAGLDFYRRVIGWKTESFPGMQPRYDVLTVPGAAMGVGGAMALTDEMRSRGVPPCWTGYVGVTDVDATVSRITSTGGSVMSPAMDIPNVGRFAVVCDPWGAAFIVFKPTDREAPPRPAPGTPGTIGWHELHAGDGPKAWEWYSGLFRWEKDMAVDMGPMGVYQTFKTGVSAGGGMMTKMKEMPVSCWLYYFNVDAADAAAARVTEHGGKVLMGPHEVPGGQWIVQCLDPQGAMFAVVAPKR